MLLRKKEVYTTITPIPGFIPRQLAIDILHSHSEVITLNPLVLDHKAIKAPRDAAADEFYSTWYEIIERIQYVPGIGRAGSGKISFNGCFHDMPWGLQTHIYAPLNVDLRNKYRIDGNQPGYEPPVQPEIGLAGLGAPADGLYLREDIEIKCNIAVMSFVKAQLKAASKEMVSRIIKKAELLDAGVLKAMIEDGKLKTINPADRSHRQSTMPVVMSPDSSPSSAYTQPQAPLSPGLPYQIPRPQSTQFGQSPPPGRQPYIPTQNYAMELPASAPGDQPKGQTVVMELPGDFYHPQASPNAVPPPQLSPALSQHSAPENNHRYSQNSSQPSPGMRPASISVQPAGYQYGHKAFAELPSQAELPNESRFEPSQTTSHNGDFKLEPAPKTQQGYAYNPADYANMGR